MKSTNRISLALVLVLFAACGGKVVVDGEPGGSGEGGNGQGGSQGQGAFGQSCMNPPDPSKIQGCSGGVTTGSGSISCVTDLCDADGNVFEAECKTTTCICVVNGTVKCSCALDGPGDFCGGTPNCCPWTPSPGN